MLKQRLWTMPRFNNVKSYNQIISDMNNIFAYPILNGTVPSFPVPIIEEIGFADMQRFYVDIRLDIKKGYGHLNAKALRTSD